MDASVDAETQALLPNEDSAPTSSKHILELSQVERKDGNRKWILLLCLSTMWMATFHCIFSISSLEYSLEDDLGLSDSQFASLTSVVFLCAVFSAALTPGSQNTLIVMLVFYPRCLPSLLHLMLHIQPSSTDSDFTTASQLLPWQRSLVSFCFMLAFCSETALANQFPNS